MNKDIFWITRLRALSTFFVIFLHVSAPFAASFDANDISFNWWVGNVFNSFSRFCVPIFLMITGALMFSEKTSLIKFYLKRLKRVLIPFLFWSCIYIALTLNVNYSTIYELLDFETFKYVLSLLFAGNQMSFHLWYVYMILGIYLFIPIVGTWVKESSNNELLIVLTIWITSIILEYSMLKKLNIQLDLHYFSGYMGYVLLGYFLFRLNKKYIYFGFFLIIVGFLTTLFGTYFICLKNGQFEHFFYENLSINVILLSAGIFLIIKSESINYLFPKQIISLVAEYSYGIYLSHILVLNLFSQLYLDGKTLNPILAVPLISFLCLFVSMLLIWVLKKIPYLKKIVG
jgi:surface polysaccharide O-acyltransferase-like enzyme